MSVLWNGLERKPMKRGKTRIRPVSRKQAKRNRELAKTKARLIEERGPYCEAARLYDEYLFAHPEESRLNSDVMVVKVCCTRRASELHHVVPRSQGGSDEDSNLLLLCATDHLLATNSDPIAYAVGMLIKGAGLPIRKGIAS